MQHPRRACSARVARERLHPRLRLVVLGLMAERRSILDCPGLLELPRDVWVRCEAGAGHDGKHTGWLDGQRYWWAAQHARAARLVRKSVQRERPAVESEERSDG